MNKYTSADTTRFWYKVACAGEDECWTWHGALSPGGYGRFCYHNGLYQAHRVSWEIANGTIPDRLYVLHTCDNRACVNPKHLFLGSHTDNMRDMDAKGRRVSHYGEDHVSHKLTYQQVEAIRELYAQGNVTKKTLGQQFGVCDTQIGHIVRGNAWKRPS